MTVNNDRSELLGIGHRSQAFAKETSSTIETQGGEERLRALEKSIMVGNEKISAIRDETRSIKERIDNGEKAIKKTSKDIRQLKYAACCLTIALLIIGGTILFKRFS